LNRDEGRSVILHILFSMAPRASSPVTIHGARAIVGWRKRSVTRSD